eukprot:scaffold3930_cov116-Isochrysis_galbana.AAC.1
MEPSPPKCYLLVHNISKKKNFGDILRTAAAMGVTEVAVVGAQKLAAHGSQGCASHLRFSHFNKMEDAVTYLRTVCGATITGIEITDSAKPVHTHPFRGTHAFMVGNEGHGLTPPQLAACDDFVYIPQHTSATASLNVNAACAVVLHHFATWAQFAEAPRDGFKFVTEPPAASSLPRSGVGLKQMRSLHADGSVVQRRKTDGASATGSADEDESGAAWQTAFGAEIGDEREEAAGE